MNAHQQHQALVNEYKESTQTVRRFKKNAIAFQIGVWSIAGILKYLQVQHLYLFAASLFGILLLTRIRDFNRRRMLDQNMTLITLEGLKLEKYTRGLDSFFHDSLMNFGIIRVMVQRALFDVGALYFFVMAVGRLILDIKPDFTISSGVLYPLVGALGFFVSDLYYKPLKALALAKKEAFSL